jgi:hypothetical protein
MAKSKQVSMSRAKLAATGEGLEVAGAEITMAGVAKMAEGVEDLEVAKAAVAVGVAEVA